MLLLYTLTIFLGAALLFLVQPMVARMLLPLLGGSPAVWNTCMLFFQAALLAGYLWAHASLRALGPRCQAAIHAPLMLLAILALPIALPAGEPPVEGTPIPWLLSALALAVGLPFLAVASAGPVLQRWFSATDHPAARDPYFLYAASNAGSLAGLLAYPALLEPLLTLRQQSTLFTAGYTLFALATLACALTLRKGPASPTPAAPPTAADDAPPTWRERALWILLAFAPSSLMLGATQYLSTDIAAIPLLWVIPLALYLITFILAFARRELIPLESVARLLPIVTVALALAFLLEARRPAWVLILLHLAMLFFGALLCHQRLAAARPRASRLTEFYLLISLGGVLGGVFNALAAPALFDTVLEYPIAIVLVCLLRPRTGEPSSARRLLADLAAPAALAVYLLIAAEAVGPQGTSPGPVRILAYGLPALGCFLLSRRVLPFGAAVAALLGVATLLPATGGRALLTERTFFGVHRVGVELDGTTKVLYHGTTVHGVQMSDQEGRARPATYYHPAGPIGQLFAALQGDPRLDRVGLVGMGVGSLAAYGEPGQRWTFFEIDPAVVRIARDSGHFSYLADGRARTDVVLGDGRRSLARCPDGEFGLIVLDAFSSDAIPVHLLTREAVALYRSKLRPGGLLAFHISNRHLDLWPVLGAIARDLGMTGFIADDTAGDDRFDHEGKTASIWVVLADAPAHGAPLLRTDLWQPFAPAAAGPLWTDERSNLLGILRLR